MFLKFYRESTLIDESKNSNINSNGKGILVNDKINGKSNVIWYSKSGLSVIRQFLCECDPVDFALCSPFPIIENDDDIPIQTYIKEKETKDENNNEAIVAILLTSKLLRLHLNSGEIFDIQLPYPMIKIFSSPYGIILERYKSHDSYLNHVTNSNQVVFSPKATKKDSSLPLLFSLSHQSAQLRPIQINFNHDDDDDDDDDDENIDTDSDHNKKDIIFQDNHDDNNNNNNKLTFTSSLIKDMSPSIPELTIPKKIDAVRFNDIDYNSGSIRPLSNENIMAVNGSYICTLNNNTGSLCLWQLNQSPPASPVDISVASLDVTSNSLEKMKNTLSSNAHSEIGNTFDNIGNTTNNIFVGTYNSDQFSAINSSNHSAAFSIGSSTFRHINHPKTSPGSIVSSSSIVNNNNSNVLASMLGISPPISRSREDSRGGSSGNSSPSVQMLNQHQLGYGRERSGRSTPVMDIIMGGLSTESPLVQTGLNIEINNELEPIDLPWMEILDPELSLVQLASTCEMHKVLGNDLNNNDFTISFSISLNSNIGYNLHVLYRPSGSIFIFSIVTDTISDEKMKFYSDKKMFLKLLKITSCFEDNPSQHKCNSSANALLPIGHPSINNCKGVSDIQIPITLLEDYRSDDDKYTISFLFGSHIFGKADVVLNDDLDGDIQLLRKNGDINQGGILSSLHIKENKFQVSIESNEDSIIGKKERKRFIVSLPTALFIDKSYPNQDVAIAFSSIINSCENSSFIEALLGYMIAIDIYLGSEYVLPCLLTSCFIRNNIDKSSFCSYITNKSQDNNIQVLLDNFIYFSKLCTDKLSFMVFDIAHMIWIDLRLNSNRQTASIKLCKSLLNFVSSSNSTLATNYIELYQSYLNHLNIKFDDSDPFIPISSGVAFLFTDIEDPPCSIKWLCEYISVISNVKLFFNDNLSEGVIFPTLSFPSNFYFYCPSLRVCQGLFSYFIYGSNNNDIVYSSWAHRFTDAFVHCFDHRLDKKMDKDDNSDILSSLVLFPSVLRNIIAMSMNQCVHNPLRSWPDSVLTLIGRNDLCNHHKFIPLSNPSSTDLSKRRGANERHGSDDGLLEVESTASQLRFNEDDRVHEVCRILQSSRNIYLRVDRTAEVSDLEHRQKLQMRLLTLCRRTFACSVGRGMLTMGSLEPLMAEALPIPQLNITGRVPPLNNLITLETTNAPPELVLWPEFHNGVAAGLRVGLRSQLISDEMTSRENGMPVKRVTRNWIIYNRTAAIASAGDASHAGVLLALGLQGHLNVLSTADIIDYLTQGHEPTTVAILIGLAASKLGTADTLLSKTLCLHLPALLPPRHWDIEISPVVQTAALIGLGLLHCGSGHRLMTEFLLAELSRRPSSDRCETREAMALSVAWSLGMVLLGKGCLDSDGTSNGLNGLADLHIEERLQQHMDGGKRPSESKLFPVASVSTDANVKSSRVLEGENININVTSPGATIALSMIYIRSNNFEIAKRLDFPRTIFALDSIRPDLLFYRAVGKCLVLWDSVGKTEGWIDEQMPEHIMKTLFPTEKNKENDIVKNKYQNPYTIKIGKQSNLPPKVAFSSFLSITMGFCCGIGLVFAGTGDDVAKNTVLSKLKMFQHFRDLKSPFPFTFSLDKSMRPLIEMCISCTSIALSYIMAGTGDLDCLRIFRELRWKVDDVNYGIQLSLSMSIGMLFLAGGNASLKRDTLSTCCLLMSILPRFPMRTPDNQYHLQVKKY
jgi:hypothetical protein